MWLKELTDDQQDLVIDMMVEFQQEVNEYLQAQNARLLEALKNLLNFPQADLDVWEKTGATITLTAWHFQQARAAIAAVNATEGVEAETLEGKHLNEIILERNRLRIEVENLHGKFTPILQKNTRLLEALEKITSWAEQEVGFWNDEHPIEAARAAIAEAE